MSKATTKKKKPRNKKPEKPFREVARDTAVYAMLDLLQGRATETRARDEVAAARLVAELLHL